MPWFNNLIPEYVKKSVCSCLIKRYLSQFIENEITRDQLNLDLYNGRGTAERISLAVEALNELGETQNWPVEFVDGYIDKIHINVPWTTILKDSTFVEICGLKVTVQPKQRKEDATSMFESMWNSMTSSMHLAEEYAKEEAANEKTAPAIEGIELFAQTIESIVGRIKITFRNTIIQVEHLPKESEKGVGVMLNIDLMEYFDECGEDPNNEEATELSQDESKKAYLISSFATKKIVIEGVSLSSIEFYCIDRTFSRSLIRTDSHDSKEEETFFDPGDSEETKQPEDECKANEDLNLDRHVIVFGKFCNRQEVRIKIKQSENLSGPKVAIEVNLGSLILFLSPRQFHILLELVDGFSCPSSEDNSNVAQKNKCTTKHMTDKDYEKVEEELQSLLNPLANFQAFNLQQMHGWSTGALDESSDSQYLPMKDAVSGMYDSAMSGVSSSMESSITSSMVSSSLTEHTTHTHRRLSNIDADPTAEISRFQIRLGTLAVILLHEDLLALPTDNERVLVKQMQNTAEGFFKEIDYSCFIGYSGREFKDVHDAFEHACCLNHLRLLASPIHIEADEKTTSTAFSISGHLTASKLELLECLYNDGKPNHIPLLSFHMSDVASSPSSVKPSVKLKFKHVKKTGKSGGSRRNGPKTDLNISLNQCCVEFDLSIVDRITALLSHPPICGRVKKQNDVWRTNLSNQTQFVTVSTVESCLNLKVDCPSLNIKLRFPIPDYRPPHDMSKVPWWERNIRSDYLTLSLTEASFHSIFHTAQACNEYSIECKILDVFYYESENGPGIHIGKAGKDEKYLSLIQDSPSNVRLSFKIFPKKTLTEDDIEPDPMTHSCYGAFENQGNPQPGPFSAKRVVHESDTPHSKLHKDDAEELIIPGDKSELDSFIKSTSSSARILVDLSVPIISAQLQSKHVYELIYNRISNDLLLWEPGAPKPSKTNLYKPGYGNFNDLESEDRFLMCKSGIQYESDSDSSDESSTGGASVFHSTYDVRMKRSQRLSHNNLKITKGQSDFILNLQIGEGLLSINPPVRDVATNNVIPGQQGEFLLSLNDANVFIVSGYKGDDDLGYVCVQMGNAQLYHCDMQPVPSTSPPLREVGAIVGKNLFPTIYRSDDKLLASSKSRGGDREMFTVAVKIQANHKTHHVKVIQVSLGLNKATLGHKMGREPNSWISHLLDFFNVHDHPIPGYHAKDVLTELHLHLWDCAIDYRPLHIPVRSLITIGNFSLSSHLTAIANTSTLRLIFEECGLFLSEKAPPRNGVASSAKVDLAKDYINVMELGLFEISIKTTDKKSGLNPHIDLRASNNMLNIRTCSDSGRALFQLLTYFINDGDLCPELQKSDSVTSSPKHLAEEELVSVEQQEVILSKSQQEQVSELLEEAMEESFRPNEDDATIFAPTGAKLFYFPDEKETLEDIPSRPLTQVTTELGDVTAYNLNKNNDTDDEFCIVGNEAVSGLFPKDGVPEITWLTEEPVKVIENYISVPIGKKDLLQPPKDFPTPVMRYTLCEMSLVWQMYGGNDFKATDRDAKKEVRFLETQFSDKVSFSNRKNEVTINKEQDMKVLGMHWMRQGGLNRNHSVLMELQLNKVRFQYEAYPETTTQASRLVLLVSDVEIRDRLEFSQINKFLYQYSSQARPKKSHSNMVVVKALHIRPDPKLKTQECCLKVSLLPIRLNIDQDSLLFLINFFKELGGDTSTTVAEPLNKDSSSQNTPTHQPPVMTVSSDNEEEIKQQAQKAVNENLILLMEESKYHAEPEENLGSSMSNVADESPIYFRKVVFSPDVLIRLDYHGKRVDMSHGPLAGLLMGLGQLNCSELRLKRIVYRHGLLGFAKLLFYLLQEWLTDIKKNQLSTILGGVGPMHALLQLFQGVRDLFWLPIEQYQKDGRIVRGLQRGANSFTTSTAMAALELTTRIIYLIQITAETAYDMLSPGPSIRTRRLAKLKGRKKRYHQPQDIREGLTNACMVVKEGICETADNIVQVATLEKEQKGYSGAVGAVIRQIPPTIFKPIVIATEAFTNVAGGMQSQLVPDARQEANQKWRSNDS